MAIGLKERASVAPAVGAIARPGRRTRLHKLVIPVLVAVLAGVAAGFVVHSLVTSGDEAARIRDIQARRAEAMVSAYERAWMGVQPTEWRVSVTGTGPGLAWVADRQAAWAENAITGTGPGLVTVAQMQAGYEPGITPTGTGPGLEHLPGPAGADVAVIGTP